MCFYQKMKTDREHDKSGRGPFDMFHKETINKERELGTEC